MDLALYWIVGRVQFWTKVQDNLNYIDIECVGGNCLVAHALALISFYYLLVHCTNG